MRGTTPALVALLVSSLQPLPLSAQLDVGWYTLGVGSYSADADLLAGGTTLLGRGRSIVAYRAGALTFDVAYEHVVQRQPAGGGFGITNPGGSGPTSTDWLHLDWQLDESATHEWRHRFDRLHVSLAKGPVEVTVGRQAISWANTLFLTPADPFSPFDPSDPFREYRGGVDAVRLRGFAGAFTEIEAVVRPADTALGTTMTALARIATSAGGWAVGGWAGLLHDQPAGALFTTGGLGATSLRSELAVREGVESGAVVRATVGLDHNFTPNGKDLRVLGEVQYDGFGAADASELLSVATSEPFSRGDMQTLGRWTLATQASYQLRALVGVDAMTLVNLVDGSVLLAPGLSWSVTSYASARFGLFTSLGDGVGFLPGGTVRLGSEYGLVPTLGYASISMFF